MSDRFEDEENAQTFEDVVYDLEQVEADLARALRLRLRGIRGQLRALDLQGKLKEDTLVARWHMLYAVHSDWLTWQTPRPHADIEDQDLRNRIRRVAWKAYKEAGGAGSWGNDLDIERGDHRKP